MWKKIGVEKTWISVEKCQRGKKRDKFQWKNITYLVVASATADCSINNPKEVMHVSLLS